MERQTEHHESIQNDFRFFVGLIIAFIMSLPVWILMIWVILK